jgi:hypothetical protein
MKFDRFTKIMLVVIALLLVSILSVSGGNKLASKKLAENQLPPQFIPCGMEMCIYYPAQKTVYFYDFINGQRWELKGSFTIPPPGGEITIKEAK